MTLATARCAAAGVAFHTGAVAHQGIIAAFTAWIAFITLHFCFGPIIHNRSSRDLGSACCHGNRRIQRGIHWHGRFGDSALHLTALIDHKILWHTIAVIACGNHLLEHFYPLGRFAIFNSTQVGCALLLPAADIIK